MKPVRRNENMQEPENVNRSARPPLAMAEATEHTAQWKTHFTMSAVGSSWPSSRIFRKPLPKNCSYPMMRLSLESFSWGPPYARDQPQIHQPKVPMQSTVKFLSSVLCTFLERQHPASSMEKPACMKTTRAPQRSNQRWVSKPCKLSTSVYVLSPGRFPKMLGERSTAAVPLSKVPLRRLPLAPEEATSASKARRRSCWPPSSVCCASTSCCSSANWPRSGSNSAAAAVAAAGATTGTVSNTRRGRRGSSMVGFSLAIHTAAAPLSLGAAGAAELA
mmetsp:Transcript_24038/g.52467  ORF Transcript_24038/g.52467 Transcript_24038/m.52467 type:complete len:276 (+) Transcript_24038:1084-1911(+)